MKRILIVLVIIISTFFSCANNKKIANVNTVKNDISLSIRYYPTQMIKKFSINENGISIRLINNYSKLDSLLVKKELDSVDYKRFTQILEGYKEKSYSNKCIEDGSNYTLTHVKNDSVLNEIVFSNVYDEGLEIIIDFLNQNTPKEHEITYDKGDLLKKMEDCENLANKSGEFIDSRDNHKYNWVRIGDQTWMTENLAFKAAKGSWAYDNKDENVKNYGYLYSLDAAKKACPKGWHIPSSKEWKALLNELGGEKVAGGLLKSSSDLWKTPNKSNYEFLALPSGKVSQKDAKFSGLGNSAEYWTISPTSNAGDSFFVFELLDNSTAITEKPYAKNKFAFAVRCIKD